MQRLATVSSAIVGLLMLAGCGTPDQLDLHDMAALHSGLAVDREARTLPEGHPPVFQGLPSLPPGHPPLSDAEPVLPKGHPRLPESRPRCPVGGLMLEPPLEEHWGDGSIVAESPLISI